MGDAEDNRDAKKRLLDLIQFCNLIDTFVRTYF